MFLNRILIWVNYPDNLIIQKYAIGVVTKLFNPLITKSGINRIKQALKTNVLCK